MRSCSMRAELIELMPCSQRYIGLEFSDVYTALGSSVTFIEALDRIMPGFDVEIAKMAQRVLITPRNIDFHTGVLATKARPHISTYPHPTRLLSCAPPPSSFSLPRFVHPPRLLLTFVSLPFHVVAAPLRSPRVSRV